MDSDDKPVGGTPEHEGQDPRYLSVADAEEREVAADKYGMFKMEEKAVKSIRADVYYNTEAKNIEYKSRPLGQVVGFGLLALILLSARWWLFLLNDYLGDPYGQSLGVTTMVMMFAGAFCAFMAWPKYKYKGMDDEELDERVKSREEFRKKFRR